MTEGFGLSQRRSTVGGQEEWPAGGEWSAASSDSSVVGGVGVGDEAK